jgi:peptidyl-dipeptidase Dcp
MPGLAMNNPFFEPWKTRFGAPPFPLIEPSHFAAAYDRALSEHKAEVAVIADNAAPATFANTIVALEMSGRPLRQVEHIFHNLAASHTNEGLQAIERQMAPKLAQHANEITLNPALFARIDALYGTRANLGLDAEEMRVLERYHLDFVRAGARLGTDEKRRYAAVTERLASLGTEFAQNVLADEQDIVIALGESEVAGLPDFAREAAAETARARGLDAPYAATTSRSSAEPILAFASDRSTRERLYKAWTQRGDSGGTHDNKGLIAEIVKLRAEEANLLGYPSFAHYRLADTMAKTPETARALLERVWVPAKARAIGERDALQVLIIQEGGNFALAPWDWRFYAEKLRKTQYDLDEAEIMPYLELDRMIEAAFYTAGRLFGLSFVRCDDVPVYHPDVRVWEVTKDGKHVGLFYGDYYARSSKRGGAWMSSFRDQENLDRPISPLIVNNCNFPKPAPGRPALLSFDEAKTLFHEFGHALHGLLSNVRFPRLSGTHVAQDFVELPSQIFEHWLEEPQVLERFAIHVETGRPMPEALLEKLIAARNFNQGFATVEFLGSAFMDMDFHALQHPEDIDAAAYERATIEKIGMPAEIAMRHRPAHFLHIFAGDGYAAGYYSYMWAEVLDADGFKAFSEAGDAFDPATAKRLYEQIYSPGGTQDYAQAYRAFRGRDPKVEALLEGRGLKVA